MKSNKQEFRDNMDKLMEKIGKDEAFAKELAEKQTSAEVAEFLLDNGIRISEDTIDAVINVLKKEASSSAKVELSEDDLDAVAAGFCSSTGIDREKFVHKKGSYMDKTSDYSSYGDYYRKKYAGKDII